MNELEKVDLVRQAKELYQETKNHEMVIAEFGLNHSEEYAVNILARDFNLADAEIAEKLPVVGQLETVAEIASVLLDDLQYQQWVNRMNFKNKTFLYWYNIDRGDK